VPSRSTHHRDSVWKEGLVSNAAPPETPARSVGLDFARCIAIALVLVAHVGQALHSPIGGFFGVPRLIHVSLGGIGVTMFLIISGAVLESKYGRRPIDYLRFMAKRWMRVYPVYYLSLLVGGSIYLVRSLSAAGGLTAGHSKLGIDDLLLSATGGYAFVGRWGGPFLETSWFIALIMTMYLLFPVLSRQIEKRPLAMIGGLFLVSLVARVLVSDHAFPLSRALDWFPLCRVFEFSLGICLALALQRLPRRRRPSVSLLAGPIRFLSNLSFPLFLVHHPLLFVIDLLAGNGVGRLVAVAVFILTSVILSWVLMQIDNLVPRSRILAALDGLRKGPAYQTSEG
jgi:peptidoglycan/LPS O-acetylase OafA/YrhL